MTGPATTRDAALSAELHATSREAVARLVGGDRIGCGMRLAAGVARQVRLAGIEAELLAHGWQPTDLLN